ncbi:SpoIIE family protein phosphatase [Streptomonospora sp. S1-112]|uniref:SpoIIE family protein phosphatase n=1 Tax=Streptomonospora mangrovi TaxID=2883123 RepID=A0A9X3NR24_9ACTN|nr:SpoIIE family protein phosphatase [Streptomonospora mangrovi]MDA0567983.1 SpoIIE family protein phosphatase [Streptomonospora mangrovi]
MNGATGSTDGFAERPDIAFASAPAAMVVADRAGGVTLTNRAFAEFTGQDPGGVLGRPWPEAVAGGDPDAAWALHRAALDDALAPHRGLVVTSYGGIPHRVVAEARALPAGGPEGTPAGVAIVFREPLREEETLRVISELRTENADTALWTLDLRTGRLQELFGPSPLGRLLVGKARGLEEVLARVHRDDIARVRDAMEASQQGRDYEQRFRMFDDVGDERSLHARARYVGGERPRLIGIIDDVTEHVQLIRRLADRRRIEAAQGRQVTDLAAKLVSATTVDEVTGLLTDEFAPIFGGAGASVMLVEDGRLRASPPATADPVEPMGMADGHDAADISHPMGAVVQDRQPRFFESRAEILERFPGVAEVLHRTSAQSWATIPIFGDRRVALGVWQVAWGEPHHATPDERALMLTLAGLAGQALQRVRRQQEEQALADAIQQRMLPPQIAEFPDLRIAVRYLPSRAGWRVCGDFYDVIRLPGRRVGLVVGDVQGHGVEAAAAMGQIRVAFRAYATNQVDPGVVLAETNRLLTETGEIVFATCGYLVLDLDTGEMQAAWAGQPPAVIATPSGYDLWEPETGPPVGVDADSKYPVTTRWLRAGDTLLMCSDGLVENSEVVMEDGLRLVAEDLCAHAGDVEAAATSLIELAPAGRNDDIALLIARMADCG